MDNKHNNTLQLRVFFSLKGYSFLSYFFSPFSQKEFSSWQSSTSIVYSQLVPLFRQLKTVAISLLFLGCFFFRKL
jgi:hypothetical protein